MVIHCGGECIWLGVLTRSLPSHIGVIVNLSLLPLRSTDAALGYPMLLGGLGRLRLFSGMHIWDTHLLHCFLLGPLIGWNLLLVQQGTHTLHGSDNCCEAILS